MMIIGILWDMYITRLVEGLVTIDHVILAISICLFIFVQGAKGPVNDGKGGHT